MPFGSFVIDRNAITRLGFSIIDVNSADDIKNAKKLIFPGVGAFGVAVENLKKKGLFEALREYLQNDKPFFGICIGMQMLFEGSDENPEAEVLSCIAFFRRRFLKFCTRLLAFYLFVWLVETRYTCEKRGSTRPLVTSLMFCMPSEAGCAEV